MDFGHYLILTIAGLVLLSIFVGRVSTRIGAPLLLVFLALGMIAGEDGPGGLDFDDFRAAYAIGAASLAIVLFDGGLRTKLDTIRFASWPALSLATVGVIITAAIVGSAAHLLFGLGWIEGLLIGSIVASTDAAAVFFATHLAGINLSRRVRSVLEAESGLNDPMAVFLTVTCIELLLNAPATLGWEQIGAFTKDFLIQIVGGGLLGVAGGHVLVTLINRLKLSAGLSPILALGAALFLFAGAQAIGASGFLAAYIAGLVVGNRRHRAQQTIERFQDGVVWLCQITMFVMLGLLVTPSHLLEYLIPAVAVAVVLVFFARPLAVLICAAPFRLSWRETAFVSWVGLRGAVPIFLGTMPILAGLPNAKLYFDVAFVIVLTSLLVQGWTINLSARLLSLVLPPAAGRSLRHDIDLPEDVGRDMAVFAVQEASLATRVPLRDLAATPDTEIVAVLRDGIAHRRELIDLLLPGDQVVILGPGATLEKIDEVFGEAPSREAVERILATMGEFSFDASVAISELARAYDFAITPSDLKLTAGEFLARHLRKAPTAGDRFRLGQIELIVQATDGSEISRIGIELDPSSSTPLSRDNVRMWLRHIIERLNIRRF